MAKMAIPTDEEKLELVNFDSKKRDAKAISLSSLGPGLELYVFKKGEDISTVLG